MRAAFGGVFKFPFVACDEAVFEAILSFVVREHIGGEAAEGADLKNRSRAGKLLHCKIDQKEVAFVEHPGVGKTEPHQVVVTGFGLGLGRVYDKGSFKKGTAQQIPQFSHRERLPPKERG